MRPPHRSASHRPHGAPMRPPHRSAGHRPHGDSMRPSHRPAGHRPHRPSMNPIRPNMNGARPNRSFFIQAHSYETRPFLKSSTVKTQYRAPWVPTVNKNNPPVNRKFSTGRRNFPTVNRKFPTASRKFTTSSTKIYTADTGKKGKVGSSHNNIDDKGYWDSGCSRHMIGNISYLYDFEPFDRGYVSFVQGGCKITGKETIKTNKLEFENVVPHKDLTCLVAKASADECILWIRRKHKENVSKDKTQQKNQPEIKKPKKVGFIKRLATPKPRKPRFLLRWSPTGKMFDSVGKLVAPSNSESHVDCSNGDNACTSNTTEPKIKRFPNSTSLLG
nr:hypothetical protein [Tanacetum cinerariifolium]